MKIFITHSSKNADIGNALVELLIKVGINSDDIIFTSNTAHGIPIGKNIFNWLKERITEKPFVLYLLSPEYYQSVACLNEMGAAWVVENDHAMIFTPDFKLDSHEFQNGALDPKEIGFYIDNEDRLLSFIGSLKTSFNISTNAVLINQSIRNFIKQIKKINIPTPIIKKEKEPKEDNIPQPPVSTTPKNIPAKTDNNFSRIQSDLLKNKLKDEEVLLFKYVVDTANFKLGTAWKEEHEIKKIEEWEDINDLNNHLSKNYASVLRRLEMKNLIFVSDETSYGNPREVTLIEDLRNELLSPSNDIIQKIEEVAKRNIYKDDELPF